MLAKKNRLTSDKDFKRVMKTGKVINQPLLFIKVLPNNLTHSRFGIIVSNKVSKKATIRNRLKRQIRSLARLSLHQLPKSVDLVVIAQPPILQINFSQLKETFLSAIGKLSRIKN